MTNISMYRFRGDLLQNRMKTKLNRLVSTRFLIEKWRQKSDCKVVLGFLIESLGILYDHVIDPQRKEKLWCGDRVNECGKDWLSK
jgi:hypothetical protein